MKDFSTAYMTRRFAMGGMNPKLEESHKSEGGQMCAHGGPVMCNAGCYASGGEVESDYEAMKDDSMEDIEVSGDMDEEMDELQPDSEVPSKGAGYENDKDDGMMKKRFMSRILDGIMGAHRG